MFNFNKKDSEQNQGGHSVALLSLLLTFSKIDTLL